MSSCRDPRNHYFWYLLKLFLLTLATIIALWIFGGCKKDPIVVDPHGQKDEPRRTVSMEIHRVSKED